MTIWLLVIILSYFFFGLAGLGDKLILSGPPKPRSYTFYTGLSGIAVLIFLPFLEFHLPSKNALFWIISESIIYILALYSLYSAVEKYEVSKVATILGASQPIFIFFLTWLWQGKQIINQNILLAFIFLLSGNFILSFEKTLKIWNHFLFLTLLASFLFSLDFILLKIIFISEGFLLGFFWTRILSALIVLFFLIKKNWRKEIFSKKTFLNKKIFSLFIFTYSAGGIANFLQAFAISLAPPTLLPILNSLRGFQYIFLFLFTLFFTLFFPKILKEEITKRIILQKIGALALISVGLAILSF